MWTCVSNNHYTYLLQVETLKVRQKRSTIVNSWWSDWSVAVCVFQIQLITWNEGALDNVSSDGALDSRLYLNPRPRWGQVGPGRPRSVQVGPVGAMADQCIIIEGGVKHRDGRKVSSSVVCVVSCRVVSQCRDVCRVVCCSGSRAGASWGSCRPSPVSQKLRPLYLYVLKRDELYTVLWQWS